MTPWTGWHADVTRPEYTVRFKWNEGDIAFWDNRSTVHLAPTDIFESDFDRQLYSVTLVGKPLVSVDGQPSKSIEGVSILSAAEELTVQLVADRGERSRLAEHRGIAERLDHLTKTNMKDAWNES